MPSAFGVWEVRPSSDRDLLVVWQSFGQVRAIGHDDPVIGQETGKAIVLAENPASDVFAGAGSADMMV